MSKIIKYAAVKESPRVLKSPEILIAVAQMDESVLKDKCQLAYEEAERVVSEAKDTAEKYLQDALAQSEEVKRQAYNQGHEQGYREGMEKGQREVMVKLQDTIEQAIEKAERMQRLTTAEYSDKILQAERDVIDIALAVARKLLLREMEEDPAVVLPMVREALAKVKDQEQITIRVSPDDFDVVLQAKLELQMMVGREHCLQIVSDRTLVKGSCVVDTSYGTVDARLDTRFEMLNKALQGVLP